MMNASRMCILELLDYAEAADARYTRVSTDCRKAMGRKDEYIEKLEEEITELRTHLDHWKRHAANLEGIIAGSCNETAAVGPDHVVTNNSDEPVNQEPRTTRHTNRLHIPPAPEAPELEESVVGTLKEDEEAFPF